VRVAYIDIETNYVGKYGYRDDRFFRDSKNHLITVLGVRVLAGKDDGFFQLVGADVKKSELMKILKGVRRLITYNGRSIPDDLKGRVGFDFPVIAAQLGVVLDREFPHTDLVPECWRRNLYGGLKQVEQALGLKRELPGKHGAWAMETWRAFEKSGDKKHLEELLLYNKEDVFMLRRIERKLRTM